MTEIAGYALEGDHIRRTPLATCYKARKGGMKVFLKIYSYRSDGDVTAAAHRDLQERIRKVLDRMGNVSEEILDHGVLTGLNADNDELKDDGYFQVKPWVESAPGVQVSDLRQYMLDEFALVEPLRDDVAKAGELEKRLTDRAFLAKAVGSLVRRCHERRLVHQDLKPEQFLAVPRPDGGVLPIIADFDWSFFDGEKPLKVVSTPFYYSPEHVAGDGVGTASDVFTLGIIVFEILTGGVWPLASATEFEEGFSPKELKDVVKRGEARRTLKDVYGEAFRTGALGAERIDALDRLVAQSLSPNAAERPSARQLEDALAGARLFRVSSSGRPRPTPAASDPPVSGPPRWFRLRAVTLPDEAWTIKCDGPPENMRLDRHTAKAVFGELVDGDGTPFYKYLPARRDDGSVVSFVEFRRADDDGWSVRAGTEAKNGCLLRRGAGGEVVLDAEWVPIAVGDRLAVKSAAKGEVLEDCVLEVAAE